MAVKSIYKVEVDDGDFQRFAAMFQKYQEAAKSGPAIWQQTGKAASSAMGAAAQGAEAFQAAMEVTAGASAMTAMTVKHVGESLHQQTELLRKMSASSATTTRTVKSQATAWKDMAHSASSFAGKIGEATRSLLRWGALTGLISGVLGGGGLFGIERLAMSAGNSRRSALGLGVTPGEEKAFGVNYGRVVDPGTFLSGVNEATHDVTKRVGLYGAGLTDRDIAGKDTAQVSALLMPALKKIADATPEAMMAQVMQARHLEQFMSLQDFQRLKNTPAGEIAGYGRQFATDAAAMDLSKQQQKAWQDLQVQLQRAGAEIENTLIKGLTPLAPQFEHLSSAFTKVVGDLMSNPHLKEWIDELATGIKWFGDYIQTEDFRKHVSDFVDGVSEAATAIGKAVTAITHAVEWFTGGKAGKDVAKAWREGGVNGPLTDDNPNAPGSPAFNEKHGIKSPWSLHAPHLEPGRDKGWATDIWERAKKAWNGEGTIFGGEDLVHKESFQRSVESQNGLPPGLLDAVWKTESGRGRNLVSSAGALGDYQFMPGTARTYGVTDPFDFGQSTQGAGRYLSKLMREFHGDVAKAAAGYNWGEGNVERAVNDYGDKWRSDPRMPAETRNYIDKVVGGIGQHPGRGGVRVEIHNNTGGNAIVSSAQLAT